MKGHWSGKQWAFQSGRAAIILYLGDTEENQSQHLKALTKGSWCFLMYYSHQLCRNPREVLSVWGGRIGIQTKVRQTLNHVPFLLGYHASSPRFGLLLTEALTLYLWSSEWRPLNLSKEKPSRGSNSLPESESLASLILLYFQLCPTGFLKG